MFEENGFNNGFQYDFNGYINGNQGGGFYPPRTETHFSKGILIASLIAAVIFYFIGELIYGAFIENINSIVFMGVYFAIFGLILAVCLLVAAKISNLDISAKSLFVSAICILLLLLLGMFFEFLYELDFGKMEPVKDNYIFAIDNSGSMKTNDPNQKRTAAVLQLLENKEESVEFAVYSFGDTIEKVRDMAFSTDGVEDFAVSPNGGTPIVGVLTKIMDDMESGILSYDEGSQVILLTDGYATDNGFFGLEINSILKKFNKKKVSISTVGLGDVDERFLSNISEKTGGLSVTTDNVEALGSAMASVVRTTNAERNLLSSRVQINMNFLYVIMRIVFVTILGVVFTGIKIAMTDESVNTSMIIISSLITCFLGAVILEVGLSLILPGFIARLILVLLIGLTITMIEKVVRMELGYGTLGRL